MDPPLEGDTVVDPTVANTDASENISEVELDLTGDLASSGES